MSGTFISREIEAGRHPRTAGATRTTFVHTSAGLGMLVPSSRLGRKCQPAIEHNQNGYDQPLGLSNHDSPPFDGFTIPPGEVALGGGKTMGKAIHMQMVWSSR